MVIVHVVTTIELRAVPVNHVTRASSFDTHLEIILRDIGVVDVVSIALDKYAVAIAVHCVAPKLAAGAEYPHSDLRILRSGVPACDDCRASFDPHPEAVSGACQTTNQRLTRIDENSHLHLTNNAGAAEEYVTSGRTGN